MENIRILEIILLLLVLVIAYFKMSSNSTSIIPFNNQGSSSNANSNKTYTQNATLEPAKISHGTTLTPQGFIGSNFTSFFTFAKTAGNTVSWAGSWLQLNSSLSTPQVVEQLSSTYGYTPVIEAQFFTQSTGELLLPLNASNEEAYVGYARNFAEQYKPKYLAFGIEVNLLYEKSPANFTKFVSLFNTTYDAVKSVSPNTTVFTIFQYEHMLGLKGGLFGGANGSSEWNLLNYFNKSDIFGFTTYPGLVYGNVSKMPSDYYSQISMHTRKRIAFTEIGWQSGNIQGWSNNESTQAAFIDRFYKLSKPVNKTMELWSFMFDQNVTAPFNTMGLFYINGTAKLAWNAWISNN